MQAGLLSEHISILKPYTGDGVYGKSTKTEYVPYISTRARVKSHSGSVVTQNNEVVTSFSVTFTIRSYHKVDGYMRIKWRGNDYRILNINPATRERNEIEITAEIVNE